ncbi:MAG: 4-hydroxybutyrate CoA-transferase [Clostridiales Family XIII bacterium]|jgi:4-hydroxybutyrate CoA-transferase|nr:4-hydroxybutyrate CoA-transferase [Clostridiales Family XIII bacterium]
MRKEENKMADWREKYKEKIVSIDEALSRVKGGDRISPVGAVYSILDRLAEKVEGFDEPVTLVMALIPRELEILRPEYADKVDIESNFFGFIERGLKKNGRWVDCAPVHLSDSVYAMYAVAPPDVVVMAATPPDENGYVSFGIGGQDERITDQARVKIAQINEKVPYVKGEGVMYKLEDFDCIIDLTEDLAVSPPAKEPSETEKKIAENVLPYIKDGACIQLGIGGIANAVGSFLKDKKDLGIHTEMFVDAMVDLIECGAVNNSRKNLDKGISVMGFAGGTQLLIDYLNNNDNVITKSFTYVNNPHVISQIDDFISINGTMSVDLFGQCYSESIGFSQFSGTGGQVDFVRGARHSKGGHSFICLPSTMTRKDGTVTSKIVLNNDPGTIVTTLRADVQYVVTEYGVAYLEGQTLRSRANQLISISHPDFREELASQAKIQGLIF